MLGLLVESTPAIVLEQKVAKAKGDRVGKAQHQGAHPVNVGGPELCQAKVGQDRGQTESEPEGSAQIEFETENNAERCIGEGVPILCFFSAERREKEVCIN